jgi:hypothetical protein
MGNDLLLPDHRARSTLLLWTSERADKSCRVRTAVPCSRKPVSAVASIHTFLLIDDKLDTLHDIMSKEA